MATKQCVRCKRPLPLKAFGNDQSRHDRLRLQCLECRRVEAAKDYAADPERHWRWSLQRKYGMRPADYWQLFAAQGGVCGMCGEPETRRLKGTLSKLAVDHDHETGEIRGLLCSRCNLAVGLLDDDSALFKTGAIWIEEAKTGMFVPEN